MTHPHLLDVQGLNVGFRTKHGLVQALSDATFHVDPGETLVIIGESGSGKTVMAHALMRMLPMNASVSGSVRLSGSELLSCSERDMQRVRGRKMALIPQGAGSALNPVRKVGGLMLEMARARGLKGPEARERLEAVLGELGLAWEAVADRYPHQLSGGMQQRVVNALALVGNPDVVIADEPTHGLDPDLVDTTADQLRKIPERDAALLVITHDLRLAQRLGGRVALIYASYVVELRSSEAFFERPAHPYGRALLGALPERGGVAIPGLPVELTQLPPGCAFASRCTDRMDECSQSVPALLPVNDGAGSARCFLHA